MHNTHKMHPPSPGHVPGVAEQLTAGEIELNLTVGTIPLRTTLDLCEVLESANIHCPHEPTSVTTFSMSGDLPNIGVSVCICECVSVSVVMCIWCRAI